MTTLDRPAAGQSDPSPHLDDRGEAWAWLYPATVGHRRNPSAPGAVTRQFRYRSYYWLVDVDVLARREPVARPLRPFARFRSADHLGDPDRSLAANARAVLAEAGLRADRILLLTCPRVGGHVFNPLSVFYCLVGEPGAERLDAVIAEVHNTYGGRHVYLLRPDGTGRDTTEKRFYVSPFLPMGGRYLMRVPPPDENLAVSIALQQDGATPFVATLTGRRRPATTANVLLTLLRWPLVTLRTAALIRWQGIRLWLRRVPVQPRPPDATRAEDGR
ncbi:DUF1365 domain-containing protein [Nakamurella flava]|uniref:DUF1365 domain-containing protein n=1 Tax=Nakamurella flava TaxID=2576308 RepID=UPI00197BA9D9|nr:DUF1365 domain-containing protein [Nakamurella flava]